MPRDGDDGRESLSSELFIHRVRRESAPLVRSLGPSRRAGEIPGTWSRHRKKLALFRVAGLAEMGLPLRRWLVSTSARLSLSLSLFLPAHLSRPLSSGPSEPFMKDKQAVREVAR